MAALAQINDISNVDNPLFSLFVIGLNVVGNSDGYNVDWVNGDEVGSDDLDGLFDGDLVGLSDGDWVSVVS